MLGMPLPPMLLRQRPEGKVRSQRQKHEPSVFCAAGARGVSAAEKEIHSVNVGPLECQQKVPFPWMSSQSRSSRLSEISDNSEHTITNPTHNDIHCHITPV